jgi:uncharacterized Zn finger protein
MSGTKKANDSQQDWRDLTWDDLEAWAGSRSLERGRSYQRTHRVQQLAVSSGGILVAWVLGGQRYATEVGMRASRGGVKLFSRCTCPLGISGCKHAVAVVVQYLEVLKSGTSIPEASDEDPRWDLLDVEDEGDSEEGDFEDDYADDEEYDEDDESEWEEESRTRVRRGPSRERASPKKGAEAWRAYLEGLPVAELANFILRLADDYPEVGRDLDARTALASGKTGDLIRQARKEITRLSRQEAWVNSWTGEGNVPDYSGLKRLFEQLLDHGQADALLELGQTLFPAAQEQVEQSHDEGETASEVSACLEVVFQAVTASSRPDRDKILYVIDMMLRDEYDLCAGSEVVLDREWPAEVWSQVADTLAGRLQRESTPKKVDFIDNYRRDRLSNWLIDCLYNAGRDREVLPLCEAEAPITGSYERLVQELLAARRYDEARRWALEGIEKTEAEWPGIADQLRSRLRELAEREKDWPAVAAFRAEEFFFSPSLSTLAALQKAADKAGCGEEVRAAALHFLETSERPAPVPPPTKAVRPRGPAPKRPRGKSAGAGWPLPEPYSAKHRPRENAWSKGPHLNVLLDLALKQKRPDDVLKWYDRMRQAKRPGYYDWGAGEYSARVADAVSESHPDRAEAIYRHIAEHEIDQTSPRHYEAALPYLRKLRALLQREKKGEEWKRYLTELREKNHRKRKLLELLDRLEGRKIVEG